MSDITYVFPNMLENFILQDVLCLHAGFGNTPLTALIGHPPPHTGPHHSKSLFRSKNTAIGAKSVISLENVLQILTSGLCPCSNHS
jgi:hypothetical protein